VRMYQAENLAAGASARLTIQGIKPADADLAGADAIKPASGVSMRNIALGGAFLITIIGAGMILMKKPQARKA
jgi:hypothetical protein